MAEDRSEIHPLQVTKIYLLNILRSGPVFSYAGARDSYDDDALKGHLAVLDFRPLMSWEASMLSAPGPREIHFGRFSLDLRTGELARSGRKVQLQEQGFRILATLLQHEGELVSREELQQTLWPADTYVDFEHGLNNAIKRLREALNDSAQKPRYIQTLRRRGYRFIGKMKTQNGSGTMPGPLH